MKQFITRALQKLNKMTGEQIRDLLGSTVAEIDRLETVLDSLAYGILVCDTEHALIMANKYARRFLPLGQDEQEPIWMMVRDEHLADFFESTLRTGDRALEREFDVETKGKQRLLSISVLPLVRDRQVSGSLIHLEDITERRGKEARLRRMESLASLTTLAAGVAHEIKNPLGSLSIHIQLIQKAMKANAERRSKETGSCRYFALINKYIEVVNEEIDRLNSIVVDFLFAVRPMNMEFRAGNINNLIAEFAEFVSFELAEARITCVLELAPDLPCIDFDERYMKQALLNLVKNAIAAMPSGGALAVKTEADEAELRIHIQDTGMGIPEEHLPKIFEPYFTTKESGSGLGLTQVFKIIREHQGEITVKSKAGGGSCFTIALPIPQKEQRLIPYGDTGNTGAPKRRP
ncbi:MAG: PAS domain S-box protein [Spirochaetaceae bacterium]|jgi:PAS domain S-box-containing protein|nr:PAS domain S-box protein [Spirochaetaceae bacterium]